MTGSAPVTFIVGANDGLAGRGGPVANAWQLSRWFAKNPRVSVYEAQTAGHYRTDIVADKEAGRLTPIMINGEPPK
jgi:hypothetical protein